VTGVGFIFIVFGTLVGLLFGEDDPEKFSIANSLSLISLLLGSVILSIGFAVWLLDVMP
jgi:Na+-driven multidrug efflux pump